MQLVRDQLHFFEFGLYDVDRLQSIERLRPLCVVTKGVAQCQGAIEYTLQFWRCPAFGHPVEWRQGQLQAELLFVAFRTGRQEFKQLQAAHQQADGIFVRIHAPCYGCRALIIRERLLDHARPLVMRRNLAANRVEVLGMYGFQRLRDATVQHAALWRTDLCIRNLAQLIVGEVIAVRAVFAHDPFVPEFVQRTYGTICVGVTDGDQEVEREFAANGRGQFNKSASGDRELQEATDERRMHTWRKRSRILKRRLPAGAIGLWRTG